MSRIPSVEPEPLLGVRGIMSPVRLVWVQEDRIPSGEPAGLQEAGKWRKWDVRGFTEMGVRCLGNSTDDQTIPHELD
jgi:hypothetical protein